MTKRKRLAPSDRRQQILIAATRMAEAGLFSHITSTEIAARINISSSLVRFHFESIEFLRDMVMLHAVETTNLKIIAQGLAIRNERALRLPREIQRRAALSLVAQK